MLDAFEEVQGHQVPGAKGGQEAAGAMLNGLWLLLWCDGSQWKALSRGGSGSGWWVVNRPQGAELEQQDQSGGLYNISVSKDVAGIARSGEGDGKWLDSDCV